MVPRAGDRGDLGYGRDEVKGQAFPAIRLRRRTGAYAEEVPVSKGGKSETTRQIPDWLAPMLKPLLQGATGGLARFAAQGQNILQGQPPGEGGAVPLPGGRMTPEDLMAMRARMQR